MFKDVFELKKNAWHSKLMKYIWGFDYRDFTHICPYFWFSIFNVIISPVFLPIKFTFWTLLPKYVFKYIGFVLVAFGKIIINWFEHIGKIVDNYALEQERKWEEKQKMEIKASTPEILEKVGKMMHQASWVNWYRDSPSTITQGMSNAYYTFKEGRGGEGRGKNKKMAKWLQVLINMHRYEPDIVTRLVNERKQWLANQEEKKRWADFINTSDELNLTAEQIASAKMVSEMRDIAKDEKEQRRRKILALRAAERDKREAERRKWAQDRRLLLIKRKQQINRIFKIIKPIVSWCMYIIGSFIGLIGLYFVFKGLKWVLDKFASIKHANYVTIGHGALWLGKWLGLIGLAIGTVVLIVYLVKKIKWPTIKLPKMAIREHLPHIQIPVQAIFRPIKKVIRLLGVVIDLILEGLYYGLWLPIRFVGKIIAKTYMYIRSFFVLLIQIIKNNCPAIEWKD